MRNFIVFLGRISDYSEKHAAVIQTIIALIMLIAVFQSGQTLNLTRRQVESTIEPVLDFSMYSSNLKLINSGLAKIQKIEQAGLIAGHFDLNLNRISDYNVMYYQSPLTDTLSYGESFVLDLSGFKTFMPSPRQESEFDVYCLAIRYRRAVDMKPFLKPIQFMSAENSDKPTENVYLPLFPSPGSTFGGKARTAEQPVDPWQSAREELLRIFQSRFSLEPQ